MEDPKEESSQNQLYPNAFQRRTIWTAITAFCIVVIGAIAVGAVFLGGKVLGFLQPILVPIAIAAIIAYLLEPLISWLRIKTRWSHKRSMLLVFSIFSLLVILLIVSVVVPAFGQGRKFVEDWESHQLQVVRVFQSASEDIQERFSGPLAKEYSQKYYQRGVEWLTREGPELGQKMGSWLWDRIMGAFGFIGYLIGLILVPVYLFYFLRESHSIKKNWSDYLPLRASRFKDEVVDTLQEINQYLAAFFRGQMVVSLIDGAVVALALSLVLQLPYALLIGVFLAILGLIPYIGNILVMIPAILIAIGHFGEQTPIDYSLESDVRAGQVRMVPLPEGQRRKYVAEVREITRVKFRGESGNVTEGYVSYVPPVEPAESETDDPQIEGVPVPDPEKPVLAAPNPPEVGEAAMVTLRNGLMVEGEIVEILGSNKRAWIMTNAWSFLPNMWFYPLIVIAIFVILQQINGLVTAPLIVGDSVGLHPLTVIFSVLLWSFLLGGLLGALLAIPLTASVKVLFRRYIWLQRIEPKWKTGG